MKPIFAHSRRVTSVPPGPSAAARWRGKIAQERSTERRGRVLVIGLLIAAFFVAAITLIFGIRESILGQFGFVLAYLAISIWPFVTPRSAWLGLSCLLVVSCTALVLEGVLVWRVAAPMVIAALGVWAYRRRLGLRAERLAAASAHRARAELNGDERG